MNEPDQPPPDVLSLQNQIAALRDSEARFRAIFELAAVGIALRSLDGRWLRVNQKLCEILGYPREELVTLTSIDLTPPDERDAASSRLPAVCSPSGGNLDDKTPSMAADPGAGSGAVPGPRRIRGERKTQREEASATLVELHVNLHIRMRGKRQRERRAARARRDANMPQPALRQCVH